MKRTKLYLLVVIPVLSLCVSCGDGTDFDEGDRVLANYHVAGYAYPTVITEIGENGISVQYLDDESTETLDPAAVREARGRPRESRRRRRPGAPR